MKALRQQRGNVWLLQGEGDCVPCLKEGCEQHLDSRSDCLEQMSPRRVIEAVDEALGRRPRSISIAAAN
jgi:heptosyltransferase-3